MTATIPPKRRATPQISKYKPEFFEHEVIAASRALLEYVDDSKRSDPRWVQRKHQWIRKMITLGIRQKAAPPELVADEYEILLQGLKRLGSLPGSALEQVLYEAPLRYTFGKCHVARPFPLSLTRFAVAYEALVEAESVQPAQIAQHCIAARFRIGAGTVENYTQKGEEPRDAARVLPAQRLLASLYLDLAATNSAALRDEVFSALCATEYSPFRLYHLVVRAQAIIDPMVDDISHITSETIRELKEAAKRQRLSSMTRPPEQAHG